MKIKSYISIVMACMAVTTGIMGCGTKDESALKNVVKENIPIDENGNPSPFGKYKEPITVEIVQSINPTMTIPEGQSTTDNQYTRYIKDNINIDIKVKWQASTADYSQKLNLAIASNDLRLIMTSLFPIPSGRISSPLMESRWQLLRWMERCMDFQV